MDVVAAMEWTGTVGVEVNGEIFWSLFWISRFGLDRILLHLIGGEILGTLGTLGSNSRFFSAYQFDLLLR